MTEPLDRIEDHEDRCPECDGPAVYSLLNNLTLHIDYAHWWGCNLSTRC